MLVTVASFVLGAPREAQVQTSQTTHVIDAVDSGGSRWVSESAGTADITIEAGDTVRWEFDRANMGHNLQNNSPNWSKNEYRDPNGPAVTHTFTQPGEYRYTCTLHAGMSGTVTVVPATGPTNNPPAATDDAGETTQGASVDLDVLGNDTDPDGDTLSVGSVTDPANGTAVKSGGGVRYTPDADFTGTDTFDYTAADGRGGTDAATVRVTVAGAPANTDPEISRLTPRDGARTKDSTPAIGATVSDGESPLAASDVRLTVDGRELNTFTYNAGTGRVQYVPRKRMRAGGHDVEMTVQDGDGGRAAEAWSFRVVKRR